MDPQHPLSAMRLYALIGNGMQDVPPGFIEFLERKLDALETARTNQDRVVHLRLVPDSGLSDHLVEGLTVSGRTMVRASASAMWGDT